MPSNNKRGLGRGLQALIPKGSVFSGGRTIVNLEISKVVPNPRQPRKEFDEESLKELAESIKAQGVAQPILVRGRKGKFELIAGERRLRAAKQAGLSNIPAIVKDFSDEQSLVLSLIENLQREDLNPMDEAEGYQMLSKDFNFTQEDISGKVGKNRSTVANMLRLLELPAEIKKSLRNGELSAGHARALLAIEDKGKRLQVYRDILNNKMSVRDAEIVVYGAPNPKRSTKKAKGKPILQELIPFVEKLTSHLGTKVRIRGSVKRGRIEVDYFSQEDLERLLDLILNARIEPVETQEVNLV